MSDLTLDQVRAGAGAERLLADPVLTGALDEMVAIHTDNAIYLADATQREQSRQTVLAIRLLRDSLKQAVDWVLEARERAEHNRSLE